MHFDEVLHLNESLLSQLHPWTFSITFSLIVAAVAEVDTQSCSSEPSEQSSTPLHRAECGTQSRVNLHCNWSGEHVLLQFASSEPSLQSAVPSQSQLMWIHSLDPHIQSTCELQLCPWPLCVRCTSGQLTSSDPSRQSFCPLHFNSYEMHGPSRQVNVPLGQDLIAVDAKEQNKNIKVNNNGQNRKVVTATNGKLLSSASSKLSAS